MDPIILKSLTVLGGGGLGFLYYKFVGCKSGSCPLTSSPVISVIWGGVLAFLFIAKS